MQVDLVSTVGESVALGAAGIIMWGDATYASSRVSVLEEGGGGRPRGGGDQSNVNLQCDHRQLVGGEGRVHRRGCSTGVIYGGSHDF